MPDWEKVSLQTVGNFMAFFFFGCLPQYAVREGSRFLAPALGWKETNGTCLQRADLSGTCWGTGSRLWLSGDEKAGMVWVSCGWLPKAGVGAAARDSRQESAGDWGHDYGQTDTTLYLNPWELGVRRLVCWESGVKAYTDRPREDTQLESIWKNPELSYQAA